MTSINKNTRNTILRSTVSDLTQGLYSSSLTPKGNYRAVWLTQLRRRNQECRIPRGFGSLSGKFI